MKKISTTYRLTDEVQMIVNEEFPDHICLINYGEACSGILKHWGTKKTIIRELEDIIKKLKDTL